MTEQTINLVLAYSEQDVELANRLKNDLGAKGFTIKSELTPDLTTLLVVLVSPYTADNQDIQSLIIQASDNGQHIIPVQLGNAMRPKLISHLQQVDFSQGDALNALIERIQVLSVPGAPRPLKVLTPSVRKANRSTASWLAILAVIWFIIGIVLVGFFGVQMPASEYEGVDTEVAGTIQVYLQQNIPHSTDEAANFPATLQAAPTAQLPFLIATATAQAAPK